MFKKAILTAVEKIARIEQAPKEMQAMVAKAFISDEVKDEDVQYLFNEDTLEQLNDPEVEANVENVNAEAPEGIGAVPRAAGSSTGVGHTQRPALLQCSGQLWCRYQNQG